MVESRTHRLCERACHCRSLADPQLLSGASLDIGRRRSLSLTLTVANTCRTDRGRADDLLLRRSDHEMESSVGPRAEDLRVVNRGADNAYDMIFVDMWTEVEILYHTCGAGVSSRGGLTPFDSWTTGVKSSAGVRVVFTLRIYGRGLSHSAACRQDLAHGLEWASEDASSMGGPR